MGERPRGPPAAGTSNPHDPNAIAVKHIAGQIGYVPRDALPEVKGCSAARVTAVEGFEDMSDELHLENRCQGPPQVDIRISRAHNWICSFLAVRTPCSIVLAMYGWRKQARLVVLSPGQSDAISQAAWETEQLYIKYSSSLMRYLRSGVRNANDLEDLAQETFIRFFQARCNGQTINNPKGWLYRVGRRLAIDFGKKAKPVLLDEAGWRVVEADHAHRPEVESEERSLRSSKLPWHLLSPLEKESLLLRAEGLTFREVAEVLDVSISTAASYVARAIKKFRRAVPKSSETSKHRRATPLR